MDIAERIENDLEIMVINLRKFLVHYEKDEFELYRSCMENWFAQHASLFPEAIIYREGTYNGLLAWIDLKERDIESAPKRLSKIELLYPDQTFYSLNILKREILLVNGYAERAIVVFNKAILPAIPGCEHTGATINHNIPFF